MHNALYVERLINASDATVVLRTGGGSFGCALLPYFENAWKMLNDRFGGRGSAQRFTHPDPLQFLKSLRDLGIYRVKTRVVAWGRLGGKHGGVGSWCCSMCSGGLCLVSQTVIS